MTIVTTDRMFIAIEKKIDGYNYGYPLWSSPEGISYYNRQRNMMATTMVTNGLQVWLYMYSVHILRYIYIYIYMYTWSFPIIGVPLSHPLYFRNFHEINHTAIGVPPFMETPMYISAINKMLPDDR